MIKKYGYWWDMISGGCKKTYFFGETRKHPPLKDDQLELDFAADGLPDLWFWASNKSLVISQKPPKKLEVSYRSWVLLQIIQVIRSVLKHIETYGDLGDPIFFSGNMWRNLPGIPGSSGIRSGAGGWPQWNFWRMAMMWDPSVISLPNFGMISILSHSFWWYLFG